MAELVRLPRPWLLASIRSPAPSAVLCRLGLYRPVGTSRTYASTARSRGGARRGRSGSNSIVTKEKAQMVEASLSFLIPLTLVAPPIWRYPRQPKHFIHFLWLHGKNRLQTLWSIIGMKLMSMPKVLRSRPRFKARRGNAVPAAKALHVTMSEALAVGDKDTLRRICSGELYKTLAGTVDSRPRGERAEWELVRYDQRWRYPRLADWRFSYMPMHSGGMHLLKQAVVSIASVQRLARYDDNNGGAKIPGSERTREMIEHIVLQADIDQTTYQSGPWIVWGWLPETTYESYIEDIDNAKALQAGTI
ncbi:hypothetical protein F4779DRAFT_586184 [Xylariaceae sp. FL0662B]|nr:hypothetical protein F4779DRAFT_586184 [Xylariaceae sp. FL0662B]